MLNIQEHGNEHADIVECACGNPKLHEEDSPMSTMEKVIHEPITDEVIEDLYAQVLEPLQPQEAYMALLQLADIFPEDRRALRKLASRVKRLAHDVYNIYKARFPEED